MSMATGMGLDGLNLSRSIRENKHGMAANYNDRPLGAFHGRNHLLGASRSLLQQRLESSMEGRCARRIRWIDRI